MVETHDDGDRVQGTHNCRAYTETNRDEDLRARKNPGLKLSEDRANDGEGDERRCKNGAERGNEEVDDFRNMLVEPFLEHAHQPYGDDDRDNMALVTCPGYFKEQ